MAVLLEMIMPEGVDVAFLDAVSEEMGVESDPPPGLVVHVHFMENGRTRVVDVWESAEELDAFRMTRLMPAIQKVAAKNGVDMAAQPESSVTDVPSVVRGR